MELADSPEDREKKYEHWVKGIIPQGEWELICQSLQRGQLTDSRKFVDQIEEKINMRIGFRGPDRPNKKNKSILQNDYIVSA